MHPRLPVAPCLLLYSCFCCGSCGGTETATQSRRLAAPPPSSMPSARTTAPLLTSAGDAQLELDGALLTDPSTRAAALARLATDVIAVYRNDDPDYRALCYTMARASFLPDRSRRHLLKPGIRQELSFEGGRLTSRRLAAGSRLVVVLSVVKEPDIEINYGTGKDVAAETIADAKEPLKVEWYKGSFVTSRFAASATPRGPSALKAERPVIAPVNEMTTASRDAYS